MPNPPTAKILLVEDDTNLGFVIKDNLNLRGYRVSWCKDGVEGEDTFRAEYHDLCILDVMLPRKDGFALAESIRTINPDIPIIFLTARSLAEDKLKGFHIGGDDYITKPFELDELVCRLEVFLRRNSHRDMSVVFSIGQYEFNRQQLTLNHHAGNKILTSREAGLLELLCIHRDRVLSRNEVLTRLWGDDDYFMGRSMDVFISKLRKYLRRDPSIQITNYHSIGFKLEIRSQSA